MARLAPTGVFWGTTFLCLSHRPAKQTRSEDQNESNIKEGKARGGERLSTCATEMIYERADGPNGPNGPNGEKVLPLLCEVVQGWQRTSFSRWHDAFGFSASLFAFCSSPPHSLPTPLHSSPLHLFICIPPTFVVGNTRIIQPWTTTWTTSTQTHILSAQHTSPTHSSSFMSPSCSPPTDSSCLSASWYIYTYATYSQTLCSLDPLDI